MIYFIYFTISKFLQEAQEVIIHIPAEEDDSSLEGSDTGSSRGIESFVNFGYAARMAAMHDRDPDELDDIDHDVFFPPPPKGPPPEPPDSDEENFEDADNSSPEFLRSSYEKREDIPEVYQPDDEGDVDGIVLSHSPSDSTTGSTDQLVNGYPRVSPNYFNGAFLRQFSLNEATTEL